jgi:rhodanese-related sulfurtransferase
MTQARLTLLLSLPLLLAACGESQDGGGSREAPAAPLGFELAMASAGAASDDTASASAAAVPAPTLIDLTPEQLAERIKAGNIRLIDVRTAEEVAQGTIPGAEHIPLDQFDPAKLGADDGREVVLYCRSGRRSALAGEKLVAATGEPVEHLSGGILAWEAAGLSLEPR